MNRWEEEFQRGISFAGRQFYHAAAEVYSNLLASKQPSAESFGLLNDELGKTYVQLGKYKQAIHVFTTAIQSVSDAENKVQYEMHLAMTYRRVFEYDRAQRILTQLVEEHATTLSPLRRATLYANLAAVQGLNGFYEDGVRNTHVSLKSFDEIENTVYNATLYNNLGAMYLHLGDYETAGDYLLQSLQLGNGPHLSTVSELSRLRMYQGRFAESIAYAQEALPFVWSSLMNSDKDDLATLCLLLASLCRFTGEMPIALRLLEKSQLFFGQLNLWKEWQQVQSTFDDWSTSAHEVVHRLHANQLIEIQQFIVLLDALNAQELIHTNFSRMLDMRVLYAQALADALKMPEEQQNALIHACRFADYGLTTVEPEVVANPGRSTHAMTQYQLHPSLSVDMLHSANLPSETMGAIQHHHEHVDGSGYPFGKSFLDIPLLARALSVVDFYAEGVSLNEQPHSTVLREIENHAGTRFDAEIAKIFSHAFEPL